MTIFDHNYPVTARFNRPSPTDKTMLEFMYLKNGAYSNPDSIKSVHIFKDTNLGSADNWLDLSATSPTYGLVASDSNEHALIIFSTNSVEANYNDTPAPNIYRRGTGRFAIILEDKIPWVDADDGSDRTYYTSSTSLTTGKYWDIWTIEDNDTSSTYIHSFEFFNDNVISLTEPLMVTTRQRLVQKFINNSTILNNAGIRIIKLKDDTSTGGPYEEIQPWTSTGININSEDTIIYNWDTIDQEVGTYELQVSSTLLNQTIMSDKFNLVVR